MSEKTNNTGKSSGNASKIGGKAESTQSNSTTRPSTTANTIATKAITNNSVTGKKGK